MQSSSIPLWLAEPEIDMGISPYPGTSTMTNCPGRATEGDPARWAARRAEMNTPGPIPLGADPFAGVKEAVQDIAVNSK